MPTLGDMDDSWLGLILRNAEPVEYEHLRTRQLAEAATEAQRRRVDAEAVRAGQVRAAMVEDRRRVAELNALTDLSLRLASEHNLTALLQDAVTQARRVLGVDVAYLALAEPDDSLIIQVTDGSIGSRLRGIRLSPGSGLAGLVLQRAEPVQSTDYVADEHLVHNRGVDQVAVEEGLRTIIGAPMRLRGKVIGVLMVAQRAVRRFDSWELTLLSSLGAFAAVAIDNAQQMQSHRQAAEELSVANADLQESIASVNRAALLHDRLLDVALRGGGIDQVVSSLSEVVHGVVSFADDRDVVVATARLGQFVPAVGVAEAEGEMPSRRFASPEHRRTSVGDLSVTVPVASANTYFGCVQVRPDTSLAARDLRLLERAAMTIALVAQADRASLDADRRSTEDMLEQILGGRADDGTGLRKRSLLVGLDLTVPHLIAVAESDQTGPGAPDPLEPIVRRFGGVLGRVAGRRVALVPAAPTLLSDIIGYSAELPPATVGIGGPASGVVGLAAAYQEALACVRTLRALGRTRSWASPADLGPYRFLLSQAGRGDAQRFVDSLIGTLVSQDRARRTDLLRTADAFLSMGRHHAAVAAALHIHTNTLYQRLDRITAVLGEGWRDGTGLWTYRWRCECIGCWSRRVRRKPGSRRVRWGDCRPRVGIPGDLSRVEEVQRVEGVLDGSLHGDDARIEFLVHSCSLEQADAVLAADRAADGDGSVQQILEGGLGRGPGVLAVAGRRYQQRVEVAVAGVCDGGDLYPVSRGDGLDFGEHLRHGRPGHADVLGQDRTQSFQGWVGKSPGREQGLGLDRVVGLMSPRCARIQERLRHRSRFLVTGQPGVSTRARSSAAASASMPRCFHSSTAARHARSRSSSAAGCSPRLVSSATARPAPTSVSKAPTTVRGESVSAGRSRRVTSVITPSVPSDPTNNPARSYPRHPWWSGVRCGRQCRSRRPARRPRPPSRGRSPV